MILIKYILIGILFFGLSCQKGKLDEQKPNKGVRKKIEKTYYFYGKSLNVVPENLPDTFNENIYKYNINGDEIEFEKNPTVRERPETYFRRKIFYNKSGKEINRCFYSFADENLGCDTTIYSNNKIIKYYIPKVGRKEETETIFLNSIGLKSKVIIEDSLGIVLKIENYDYNENGKIISQVDSTEQTIEKHVFNYDNSQREINNKSFRNGILSSKMTKEYDEDGRTEKIWSFNILFLELVERYDKNDNMISSIVTEYYDRTHLRRKDIKKTFIEYGSMGLPINKTTSFKAYKGDSRLESPSFENSYVEYMKYDFDEKSRVTKIIEYIKYTKSSKEETPVLKTLKIIEYFDY